MDTTAEMVVTDEENGRFEWTMKPGYLHHPCGNSCQEKVVVVLFWINYSIHQHALALDVIQVLGGRYF